MRFFSGTVYVDGHTHHSICPRHSLPSHLGLPSPSLARRYFSVDIAFVINFWRSIQLLASAWPSVWVRQAVAPSARATNHLRHCTCTCLPLMTFVLRSASAFSVHFQGRESSVTTWMAPISAISHNQTSGHDFPSHSCLTEHKEERGEEEGSVCSCARHE